MTFDPNNPTVSGLVLTFDDEFNKVSWSDNNVANNTLWTGHGINPGAPNGIADIRANNLSVHDGYLDIAATRDGNGNWTTGMLASVNSSVQGFTQKFGYFEADIQIPHGAGSWPAWWLYSADHFTNGAPPSELDIMENAGSDTTNWGTTIHDGLGNQNGNVVQNASTITWYLDGKAITSAQKYATTDVQHMMMTLNEEVGDFGGGGPNGSTPATMHMLVDYVRVYQFAGHGVAGARQQRSGGARRRARTVGLQRRHDAQPEPRRDTVGRRVELDPRRERKPGDERRQRELQQQHGRRGQCHPAQRPPRHRRCRGEARRRERPRLRR